jgi:L-lactate permease
VLTAWVATIVGLHVSLAGVLGAWDFVRLASLAWPAAIAILALIAGRDMPRLAAAALALVLAWGDLVFARAQIAEAVRYQQLSQSWFLPATIEGLDGNEPRWSDFRGR